VLERERESVVYLLCPIFAALRRCVSRLSRGRADYLNNCSIDVYGLDLEICADVGYEGLRERFICIAQEER